jgi:hypothetical protein
MKKWKLEKDPSYSQRMRGKGIDMSGFLVKLFQTQVRVFFDLIENRNRRTS